MEDGVSLAVRGDAGHDRVDVRLRRAQQNDLVHRRTRQETAGGALGLEVGDYVGVVVAVEDKIVEADVEVVGIAGVAGQPVVTVTAGDPVVAEITDDPVLTVGSGEPVVTGGAADECHAKPSLPVWETRSGYGSIAG